jgi:hypothetical protein
MMSRLSADQVKNGVVCASAGNHAQGFAYSCKKLQIKGVVFMPIITPNQKVSQTKMFGEDSLTFPDTDKVHIVIEVRKINKSKTNNHSSARYIRNLKALMHVLESIPNVRVTAQNFAEIPFAQQVQLSHSAGVFMSMHGAGTTHIFHAAIGSPNCCALIELFPDSTIEFVHAFGYGNLARMFGMHHYRYEASLGRTSREGTVVDVEAIYALAVQAVEAVRSKPTCLHDVRDTSIPIFTGMSKFDD